ncbi:EFR1 family ferrodoxin [Marinitoga sp. 38H-ov]|uniref:EFR1 family ferrodoxin n=1 Tax=Marinitoga sp. 38H-ov TaxID=1755814 RepID=UPI0013EBED0A|nr:EFR1 family ferrodoxin [Marinitoga sp. 38H-ov]KAF2956661.1 hypothetical protein AS160_04505 [Marinitoga sp. 38H-ov]
MIMMAYFSGTGNTEYVSKLLKEKLESMGKKVEITKITLKNYDYSVDDCELFILLYPIHSFDVPWPVYKWLKKTKLNNIKTAILTVSAGAFIPPNSGSRIKLKRFFKSRNCEVFYEDDIQMPLNCIKPMEENEIYQILDKLPDKIDEIANNILNNVHKNTKPHFKGIMLSKVAIFQNLFAKIFAKGYIVNDNCNLCQWCIKNCPTNNISLKDGKIKFGLNCSLCLKCLYNCPQNAIEQKKYSFMVFKNVYNLKNYLSEVKK